MRHSSRKSHQINQSLEDHVNGYKPVRVILEYDTDPPEEVRRPNIPDLGPPQLGFVHAGKDEPPIA